MASTPKNTPRPARAPQPPRTQTEGGPTVVDQPGKPAFGEPVAPRRIDRKLVTMAEEPTPSTARRNTMDAYPDRPRAGPRRRDPGDQQPLEGATRGGGAGAAGAAGAGGSAAEEGPGYLRLRLRVVEGEARVRGVKFVEGPLDRPDTISAGLSYEAKVGGKRVAVGDVPDFGERRSFPDPTGRAGMEGHHLSEVEAPEFTVRIPADELSEAQLAELSVDLFRWRGKGPGDHIAVTELSKQPKVAVTRIARLDGLQEADVPAPVRRQLRDALKRRS
jgi:hypothetical protein